MKLIALPSFLFFVFILSVGIFVFSNNIKKEVNQLFLMLSILSSIYAFSDYNLAIANNFQTASFWTKISSVWALIECVQFHFILIFTKKVKNKNNIWLHLLYGTTAILLYFLVFKNISGPILTKNGLWVPHYSFEISYFGKILNVFQLFLAVLTIYFSTQYIRGSSNKKIKKQTYLVLIGILLPVFYGFIVAGILPQFNLFNHIPISFSAGVGWMFIAFAIWKYNLFEITPEFAARKIISSMKEALLLVDYSGNIIEANSMFYDMFGLTPPEVEQHRVEEIIKLVRISENEQLIDYRFKELTFSGVKISLKKDQVIYIDLSTFFIYNKKNELAGYVFLIRNTTSLVLALEEIEKQQEQMVKMAHQAGMAEVATNIVHNIGNVLNSVNISTEQLNTVLMDSKIENLLKSNQLLADNFHNLPEFLYSDPKGKLLPQYYIEIGNILKQEYDKLKKEVVSLTDKIKIIKEIIDIQQDYAVTRELYEEIDIKWLLNEIVRIVNESLKKLNIGLFIEIPEKINTIIDAPKSKLLNVLLNIIKNSIEAVKMNINVKPNITIKLLHPTPGTIQIDISDNGIGIKKEDLLQIFTFGFTTRRNGHGFGLHFCANAIHEMKGTITATSDGLNKGARFTVIIPTRAGFEAIAKL